MTSDMSKRHEWGPARRIARVGLLIGAGLMVASFAGCLSAEKAAEFERAAAQRSELTGHDAPEFKLPNQDGKPVRLADYRGRWVVLYFYPADGTPGCTCQAQEFTQTHEQFQKLDAKVFGISPDTVASHRQFVDEFNLKIDLLADPERDVMQDYGAAVKTPFGWKIVRSTVLIDPQGAVAYHWPEVIPEGHAGRVRDTLAEMKAQYSGS